MQGLMSVKLVFRAGLSATPTCHLSQDINDLFHV